MSRRLALTRKKPATWTRLINDLRAEHGVAVLLIEHDMSLVMGISDDILVMGYGRPIATGTPDEIRGDPRVIKAYLGKSDDAETGQRPYVLWPDRGAQGVSLEVHPGEIVTLIGANGAGKEHAADDHLRLARRQRKGSVIFEGQDITRKPTHVIMQCGLAQVPEGRRIFPA